MNESKGTALLYDTIPAVAGLNKVPGFDPRKLLRREFSEATKEEVLKLDLRYKRLWFRLYHPEGRIRLNALKITEQLAVIEAQVYLDRGDPEPVSNFTSQHSIADTPSGLYVQAAQWEAMNEALNDAGFGAQFCDVEPRKENYGTEISLNRERAEQPRQAAPAEQKEARADMLTQPVAAPQEAVLPPRAEEAPAPIAQTMERTEPAPAPQTAEQVKPAPQEPARVTENAPADTGTPAVHSVGTPVQSGATAFHLAAAAERNEEESPTVEEPAPAQAAGPRYTPDMPIKEICDLMSLEEAQNLVVDVGTCSGWTMAQVADRRAASLKWYIFSDQIKSNVLKAAAQKMLGHLTELQKAG